MDIERIRGFTMLMRLADKAALVGGGLTTSAMDRPKLESFELGDFLLPYAVDGTSELALGCTFSPELCRAVADVRKLEAAQAHNVFAGVVHAGLMRDPMSVSASEFFSEDPILASELLKSFDDSYGMGFVYADCLGQGRFVNRTIDSRALRELYLLPLAKAGKTAAAVQFDGGYVNGEKVYASDGIYEIYGGYVNADTAFLTHYGVVNGDEGRSAEQLLGNGQTYLLGAKSTVARELAYGVGSGVIAESKLNRCIERTLAKLVAAHEFYADPLASELKAAVMPNLAIDSSVLLKNDGVLPTDSRKLTVFGDRAMFVDGAQYNIFDPSDTDKLGAVNVFLVTDYEENGVDARTARAIQGSCAIAKTVVVLCGTVATPLAFCENANALLFCPSDVRVRDVAEMLTATAPRGHLPFTWCKTRSAYPCNNAKYTARGDFRYESVYNGYMLFNNFKSEVSYPFGHGLDYTEYEMSKLKVTSDGVKLHAEFIVKNVGAHAGVALCQAYITLQNAPVYGLTGRLAAFKRVPLERTENAHVEFDIDLNDFAVFDETANVSAPLGGKYRVCIGLSSTDIRLSNEVRVAIGSRSNAGLSQKNAPAYYGIGGKFEPTAPEIEKLLKVPFIKKPDEYRDILPPSDADIKKQLKKAEKYAPPRILPLLKYKIKTTPNV